VGRASNRKKGLRQAGQKSQADAGRLQVMRQLAAGLQAMVEESQDRQEREAAAARIWSGGTEPVPAEAPRWTEDSLGGRFFGGTFIEEARSAPGLATAQIPDAAVIAADPAHWNVAANALIRAVAFDGLGLDHPAVSTLLEVFAPIAEAELAYGEAADAAMYGGYVDWDDEPEFPEDDGPVFLVGGCALMDATWAAVGEDSLSEVLGVLVPVLDAVVPGLDGQVTADALIGAFAREFRCEQPGDAEVLERIGDVQGNALVNLVRAGAVPPRDALPVALQLLSALAELCRSESASLLPVRRLSGRGPQRGSAGAGTVSRAARR
jgi:hypothetical protein